MLLNERFFDRITIALSDVDASVAGLEKYYDLKDWSEVCENGTVLKIAKMGGTGVQLALADANDKASVYGKFASGLGTGICCVREVISPDRWDEETAHYRQVGINAIHAEEVHGESVVFYDTATQFGGLVALVKSERTPEIKEGGRKLTQINVVTDDVDRTVAEIARILRISPWSIGTLNNVSVTNPRILVNGELTEPEFSFQLGIAFPGNIEFEVIQPVKGPTVYKDYLENHGIGYHHIKEVVDHTKWDETLSHYRSIGMDLSIIGQVGPTHFAYLASQQQFGFIVELGDGLAADPLPEGYNEYTYSA